MYLWKHHSEHIILQPRLGHLPSLDMLNYLLSLIPSSIDDDVLGSWLKIMLMLDFVSYESQSHLLYYTLEEPSRVFMEFLKDGMKFQQLIGYFSHWALEYLNINLFLLLFGLPPSCLLPVILFIFITRIAKASQDNEQAKHTLISTSLAHEILPLVASKELDLPKLVTVRIDPLREDIEKIDGC
ncbi:hypothetical protein RIF29_21624 [Crotalaria pallida]|uniref:Uncharacterized protein n=1 Tax=Crotalaria pallida TaxID=3830 RepID=A0AAN9I8M4_CROPI